MNSSTIISRALLEDSIPDVRAAGHPELGLNHEAILSRMRTEKAPAPVADAYDLNFRVSVPANGGAFLVNVNWQEPIPITEQRSCLNCSPNTTRYKNAGPFMVKNSAAVAKMLDQCVA